MKISIVGILDNLDVDEVRIPQEGLRIKHHKKHDVNKYNL